MRDVALGEIRTRDGYVKKKEKGEDDALFVHCHAHAKTSAVSLNIETDDPVSIEKWDRPLCRWPLLTAILKWLP